jgi:hypothetical protein
MIAAKKANRITKADVSPVIYFAQLRNQCAKRRNDRSIGSPSRQSVDHFREARVVRITLGGFAIWLDPFGMLDPQIVVNLLLKFGVGVDWMRHGNRPR